MGQDAHIGDAVAEVVGHHVVVDAPTEVLRTSTSAETPPAVLVGLLYQLTETVDLAITQKFRHPLALFGQEA